MNNKQENYIFKLCKDYKLYFIILFILAIAASFTAVRIHYGMKEIIDSINSGDISNIYRILITFIAFKFAYHGIHWIRRLFDLHYKPKILNQIVEDCYKKISAHSLNWFDSNLSGKITGKIFDIQSNFLTLNSNIFTLMRGIFKIIFGFVLLYLVHYSLLVTTVIFCLIYLLIMIPVTKKQMELQEIYTENRQKTFGTVNDIFANIFLVKIISNVFSEFQYQLKPDLKKWSAYEVKTRQFDTFVVDVISTIAVTSILGMQTFLAVHLYLKGEISIGFVVMSMVSAFNNGTLIEEIVDLISFEINPKIAALKESVKVLDSNLDMKNQENAKILTNVKGDIEFKNVDFGYNDHSNIFNDFNITIKSGEKIGIVGPSGSGKTTFIKCLLRYFDVKNGGIFIDGQNIKDITQESLYANISIIPQDSAVFHRTILENLQIANYNASFEEIIEICKKVQIHDDIIKMKNQYQSIVGERGVKLSGGQRQRIAIARALLKNSSIVLLDEATSALDSPTEKLIQKALNEAFLSSHSTMIIIAHRLSTITNCDRILVFENGKIVEIGTHKELLEKDGLYKKLSDAQTYFY